MTISDGIAITGVGSVSTFGALEGLIGQRESEPRPVAWAEDGARRAFTVEPFRVGTVVQGLKVRRLDRLSVWSLVTASLALRNAGIRLEPEDRSRCAVVLGSGFGCIETTEGFFRTVAQCGYGMADPILFPDSLDNSAASHVARQLALTGPNITLSCRGVSGEAALIEAASLIRAGETGMAVVMAGDTLTRPLYEWLDAPGVLSQRRGGVMPGEGLAAFMMERAPRNRSAYATFHRGAMGGDPQATGSGWPRDGRTLAQLIRKVLGDVDPSAIRWIVSCANGDPALDRIEAAAIEEVFGSRNEARILAPKRSFGEFDASAALRLVVALSSDAHLSGLGIMLGVSAGGGCAALLLSIP
jgi:3-oxoacyl-[acyl-carrier-protein] synthase II